MNNSYLTLMHKYNQLQSSFTKGILSIHTNESNTLLKEKTSIFSLHID